MSYVVVKDFTDLKDEGHIYRSGDTYPREGSDLDEDRAEELATDVNKRKEILIETVESENKQDDDNNVYPKHSGGAYFELSNGDKVQGKQAAIEAEKALKEDDE